MPHHIAVFDTRLLPEAQAQIQALSASPIAFPKQPCSAAELISRTGNSDIVLVGPRDKVTADYLNACPQVRYIGLCGTSTANINLDELAKRGIVFSNVVHRGKEPVAEFFFMQLVMLARGIGKYQWKADKLELMGKSIGIIGLGAVGSSIAHLALAYKMNVSYVGPHRKPEWEYRGLSYREIGELLSLSEIVIISTPTNLQVLGESEFRLIRPGSILVQASGGSPFDKTAFLAWIAQDGNYAIFDGSAGDEIYQLYKETPRVIFSADVAGDTHEANARRGHRVVENLKAYMKQGSGRVHE